MISTTVAPVLHPTRLPCLHNPLNISQYQKIKKYCTKEREQYDDAKQSGAAAAAKLLAKFDKGKTALGCNAHQCTT